MGRIAMSMKQKYDLKKQDEYVKACDEIRRDFENRINSVPPVPVFTIGGTPSPAQPATGQSVLIFEISDTINGDLRRLVEAEYKSHPQHMSGVWGDLQAHPDHLHVQIPTQYLSNSSRITDLVREVFELAQMKWRIGEERKRNAAIRAFEAERDGELKDLDALKAFP